MVSLIEGQTSEQCVLEWTMMSEDHGKLMSTCCSLQKRHLSARACWCIPYLKVPRVSCKKFQQQILFVASWMCVCPAHLTEANGISFWQCPLVVLFNCTQTTPQTIENKNTKHVEAVLNSNSVNWQYSSLLYISLDILYLIKSKEDSLNFSLNLLLLNHDNTLQPFMNLQKITIFVMNIIKNNIFATC